MNTTSRMNFSSKFKNTIAAGLVAGALSSAGANSSSAATTSINLAGWSTFGGWDNPTNSRITISLGVGAEVYGYDFLDVSFATIDPSWGSEMVFSASTSDLTTGYLDWIPVPIDNPGTFGPVTGSWDGAVGVAGPFGPGGPFTLGDGNLLVQIYEGFDDNNPGPDATITAGTLVIYYTEAVPEPGVGMMTLLGALGLCLVRRRKVAV